MKGRPIVDPKDLAIRLLHIELKKAAKLLKSLDISKRHERQSFFIEAAINSTAKYVKE